MVTLSVAFSVQAMEERKPQQKPNSSLMRFSTHIELKKFGNPQKFKSLNLNLGRIKEKHVLSPGQAFLPMSPPFVQNTQPLKDTWPLAEAC